MVLRPAASRSHGGSTKNTAVAPVGDIIAELLKCDGVTMDRTGVVEERGTEMTGAHVSDILHKRGGRVQAQEKYTEALKAIRRGRLNIYHWKVAFERNSTHGGVWKVGIVTGCTINEESGMFEKKWSIYVEDDGGLEALGESQLAESVALCAYLVTTDTNREMDVYPKARRIERGICRLEDDTRRCVDDDGSGSWKSDGEVQRRNVRNRKTEEEMSGFKDFDEVDVELIPDESKVADGADQTNEEGILQEDKEDLRDRDPDAAGLSEDSDRDTDETNPDDD